MPAAAAPPPGQLDRALVGLRPRVAQEHLPTAAEQPVERGGHLRARRSLPNRLDTCEQRRRLLGDGRGAPPDGRGRARSPPGRRGSRGSGVPSSSHSSVPRPRTNVTGGVGVRGHERRHGARSPHRQHSASLCRCLHGYSGWCGDRRQGLPPNCLLERARRRPPAPRKATKSRSLSRPHRIFGRARAPPRHRSGFATPLRTAASTTRPRPRRRPAPTGGAALEGAATWPGEAPRRRPGPTPARA